MRILKKTHPRLCRVFYCHAKKSILVIDDHYGIESKLNKTKLWIWKSWLMMHNFLLILTLKVFFPFVVYKYIFDYITYFSLNCTLTWINKYNQIASKAKHNNTWFTSSVSKMGYKYCRKSSIILFYSFSLQSYYF